MGRNFETRAGATGRFRSEGLVSHFLRIEYSSLEVLIRNFLIVMVS